jgi:hypothetical protein
MKRGTIDITGQRFGELTVIRLGSSGRRGAFWECECSCGKTITVGGVSLRRSRRPTRSCGHEKYEKRGPLHDLTGQVFGDLTVLAFAKMVGEGAWWKCRCMCEGLTIVAANRLRTGHTRSCGCLQKRTAAKTAVSVTKNRIFPPPTRAQKAYRLMTSRIRGRFNTLLKSRGIRKTRGTFASLGYTAQQVWIHIESKFLPGMTLENRSAWHLDHIIPLSSAKTEAEIIRLFALSNLQPLWAKDNISKGNRIV